MSLPAIQRAVLTRLAEPENRAWSLDVAYPVSLPSAGQVLVKVSHAGLNPFDWQSVEYKFGITKDPKVIGRDGAGVVVRVGTEVDRFREGDRVWFCANSAGTGTGAFQEYSLHDQGELGHTPNNISDTQASTLGTGLITAGVAIFRTLGLKFETLEQREREQTRSEDRPWILIWGGAGITGVYLIQLAQLLGFKIVCAASPVNHAYVRSLGADVVLDRWLGSKELVEQIREATNDNLSIAIDNVGATTAALCYKVIEGSSSWQKERGELPTREPARLVALAGFPKAIKADPDATRVVELPRISFSTTFYGHPDFSVRLLDAYQRLLSDGSIHPARYKLVAGGLSGVESGLAQLKAGKGIGGFKLIVSIEEGAAKTPTGPVVRELKKRKSAHVEVEELVVKRQRLTA